MQINISFTSGISFLKQEINVLDGRNKQVFLFRSFTLNRIFPESCVSENFLANVLKT